MRVELELQRFDEVACMRVDRAHAADVLVALRDLRFRFGRHAQAAEYVVEKRIDVGGTFGPAERHDEQRVVVVRLALSYGLACHAARPMKNGPRLSRYCDVCSVLRISCTTADSGWRFGPSRPTMKSLSFLSRPWQASRTSFACPPAP